MPCTGTQASQQLTLRFPFQKSGLELERHTHTGSFFDVVGRRSAVFGYENRGFEAWVYPLKILDDFNLSFELEGYPLEIRGSEIATSIQVRPEATTFTYTHAAFTVRQVLFAPVDEPGIIMLLEADSVLPLTITGSFRPRLRLMWPAGLMTGNLGWDEDAHAYFLVEETHRFVGMIGSPAARDVSVMPYQEEPRDLPARFIIQRPPETLRSHLIPIIITGSVQGREEATANYDRLLKTARRLYETNVAYYKRLQVATVSIRTPDPRLNSAFDWAKVGIDKGMATNPLLGNGLVAGFRTSGDSERPGFAWFFGRDALWTSFAMTSYGDFASTRTALDFLKQFQREDGKIPHEISQSASLLPWFEDYPYAWASADATPLYIIAQADYWKASGDIEFLKRNWDSIVKAYRFSAATDTDGNGLIENTHFGHGWVEGGALYPAHEEIYLQGLWIQALSDLGSMARAMDQQELAAETTSAAALTRQAVEDTYWIDGQGHYAFATHLPPSHPRIAEAGPNREIRQSRITALDTMHRIDEDTVLPAVPLWWRTLDKARAQDQLDHIGSGSMATDWGSRIISAHSLLYDPLSYHYGSVWPLFTGWASMGAYRYGRAHIGFQALMATSLLTFQGALGYVTELLSGDFNTAFGRSSHHQIWSEAMVIAPALRGLLGIEASDAGRLLTFAPQLPIDWDQASVTNVAVGAARCDLSFERVAGRLTILISPHDSAGPADSIRFAVAPHFPLDAQIRSVTVNGREASFQIQLTGDSQSAEVMISQSGRSTEVVFEYDEGSDVYVEAEVPVPGAKNQGLRVLRSRADASRLVLLLEGAGGHSYRLKVRTPRRLGEVSGAGIVPGSGRDRELEVRFEGSTGSYVRREVTLALHR